MEDREWRRKHLKVNIDVINIHEFYLLLQLSFAEHSILVCVDFEYNEFILADLISLVFLANLRVNCVKMLNFSDGFKHVKLG